MTPGYLTTLIITAWTAMMLVTAIFVGVESATEWMVIAGASMLPPLVMLWTWGSPAVTIAASIRQATQ